MRHYAIALALALPACIEEPPPAQDADTSTTSPRVLDGLAVLYTFDEGDGLVVHDRSGIEPTFDLQLDNLVTQSWLNGGGVEIAAPSVITSPQVAEKVFVACVQANAITLEVWIEPADLAQQATVFTYSKLNDRNVTLGQDQTRYQAQVRTSPTDPMANDPILQTTSSKPDTVTAAVQHVVYTRDAEGASVFVNGVDATPPAQSPSTPQPATDQNDWSPAYQLAIGAETNATRPFLGKIYLAAIYCKKLTAAEIQKNYDAGH